MNCTYSNASYGICAIEVLTFLNKIDEIQFSLPYWTLKGNVNAYEKLLYLTFLKIENSLLTNELVTPVDLTEIRIILMPCYSMRTTSPKNTLAPYFFSLFLNRL